MTSENDRKDEDQPEDRYYQISEAWLWALALFVSTIFVALWTGLKADGGGPIWTVAVIIFAGIPASGMGFILGMVFGAPRLTNSAERFIQRRGILALLCLGVMSFLFIAISMLV